MTRILYFASLREKIGLASEEVSLPPEVSTVGELIAWLKGRGPRYADALGDPRVVKAAVNQDYAGMEQRVEDQDEIALFPPVTGG